MILDGLRARKRCALPFAIVRQQSHFAEKLVGPQCDDFLFAVRFAFVVDCDGDFALNDDVESGADVMLLANVSAFLMYDPPHDVDQLVFLIFAQIFETFHHGPLINGVTKEFHCSKIESGVACWCDGPNTRNAGSSFSRPSSNASTSFQVAQTFR